VGQDGCGEAIDRFVPLEKALPMSMVGFPLLLIPLAIYNIIVFLMPGVSLTEPLVTLPLPSGAQWPLTLSEILLALGILMLLLEVIKGARPGAKFLTDHLLSLIVFGGAVAEFVLLPRFANSTFFLLSLLAFSDFLSGVSLRVRRGAPAAAVATRRTARSTLEPRQEAEELREPGDFQPRTSAPFNAPISREPVNPEPVNPDAVIPAPASRAVPRHAPARAEPASAEPVIATPSEPTVAHPETPVAAPAAEVPPAESVPSGESRPGTITPPPPETTR
jgi:hypothetical protein